MNAIAAHKGELEKLLEDLSSDRVFSGITFVALVDAYITRLDTNCPDISARVNPSPAQINGGLIWNQHWPRTARSITPNIKLRNVVPRFFENFALRPASELFSVTAHTRRTFQASTGTTGTTAAERRRQEIDRKMIVCVSPDPGDSARLLDYSV